MTITRNDFAMFLAALSGAWIGAAHYERGGVAAFYWVFAVVFAVVAFAIKRDAA